MGNLHIGCCGFPTARKKYFEEFDTIEVQLTFYTIPQTKTVQRWREEAPEGFRFTMKAFQGITHRYFSPTYRRARLGWEKERMLGFGHFRPTEEVHWAWQQTLQLARILQAKVIVFQCPPNFKESEQTIQNLIRFFESIERDDFSLAIEFRANWQKETIAHLCRQLNLIHCVDPFKELPVTRGLRYFRLHGAPPGEKMYRYQYTNDDLQRLKAIVLSNPEAETYCMFNNMTMREDALRFKETMREADAKQPNTPPSRP